MGQCFLEPNVKLDFFLGAKNHYSRGKEIGWDLAIVPVNKLHL